MTVKEKGISMKGRFNKCGNLCDEEDVVFAKNIGNNYYVLCDGVYPIDLDEYKKNDTTYKLRAVSSQSYEYYLEYLKARKNHNLEKSRSTIDV
jgi:hypothetical protein